MEQALPSNASGGSSPRSVVRGKTISPELGRERAALPRGFRAISPVAVSSERAESTIPGPMKSSPAQHSPQISISLVPLPLCGNTGHVHQRRHGPWPGCYNGPGWQYRPLRSAWFWWQHGLRTPTWPQVVAQSPGIFVAFGGNMGHGC